MLSTWKAFLEPQVPNLSLHPPRLNPDGNNGHVPLRTTCTSSPAWFPPVVDEAEIWYFFPTERVPPSIEVTDMQRPERSRVCTSSLPTDNACTCFIAMDATMRIKQWSTFPSNGSANICQLWTYCRPNWLLFKPLSNRREQRNGRFGAPPTGLNPKAQFTNISNSPKKAQRCNSYTMTILTHHPPLRIDCTWPNAHGDLIGTKANPSRGLWVHHSHPLLAKRLCRWLTI